MFRSGFQLCAEEALRFLKGGEKRELVAHLHRVASDLSHDTPQVIEKPSPKAQAANCVPVICRAAPISSGEQSGTDTDTDSGYGGEADKVETAQEPRKEEKTTAIALDRIIKQEQEDIPRKRQRMEVTEEEEEDSFNNGDLSAMGPYPNNPPFCLPFYFIPPSASAYLPMLEKCWYPGSMPMLYPNLAQSGLLSQERMPPVHSPPSISAMDSSALLQALKQVSSDAKD